MINEYLRHQDGVITLAQARCAGLTLQAVQRRVQSRQWRRCARGVYFVDDREFTDAARIRVGVWRYGDLAVASGLTAAWWHGMTQFAPDVVEVTIPRNSHGRSHSGTRVRRRDLGHVDVVTRRRLQLTALPLTVLEAAIRREAGPKLMDRALQRHVDLGDLWRAQVRNKGRYGSPAARILLQAAADGARSAAERLLLKLLRDAGITGWQTNCPVAGYRVDVGFPEAKVAIETDGLAFHSSSEDFHHDRVRQNAITLAGWLVLRFTWLDLTEYPERVIATIRAAISARSQPVSDR